MSFKIEAKFKIGDIVEIINEGQQYSSYHTAWRMVYPNFETLSNFKNNAFNGYLGVSEDAKKGFWRVYDIVLHTDGRHILLFLLDTTSNRGLLIDQNACKCLFHTMNKKPIIKKLL